MTPRDHDAAIRLLDDQFKPLGWHVWSTTSATHATHIRTAAEMAELTRRFQGVPAGSGETIHATTPDDMRDLLEQRTARADVILECDRQVWLGEASAARAQITAAQRSRGARPARTQRSGRMIAGLAAKVSAAVSDRRKAGRKPARHARHGKPARTRRPRRLVLASQDAETIRLFIEMNQALRLARILRATAATARSGLPPCKNCPADFFEHEIDRALVTPSPGRQAALLFLCELRDAVTAKRLNAELRRTGIDGLVGVV